jgi:uncharacterized protein
MNRQHVIDTLKSLEPRLRARGVAALYLYGSYARDEARPDSDIDVFVDPATDDFYDLEPFTEAFLDIQAALSDRQIGYGTRAGLSRYIRADVERQAIRVF